MDEDVWAGISYVLKHLPTTLLELHLALDWGEIPSPDAFMTQLWTLWRKSPNMDEINLVTDWVFFPQRPSTKACLTQWARTLNGRAGEAIVSVDGNFAVDEPASASVSPGPHIIDLE